MGSRLSFQRRPAFLVGSEERVQMTGCDEVRAMFDVVGGGKGGRGVGGWWLKGFGQRGA